jgi:hypothetical protein
MKIQLTPFYCISLVWLFISTIGFAQSEPVAADSTIIKQKYGLRLGFDVGKLVRTLIEDDYSGLELIGDFRLTNKIYLAGELGIEERTTAEDFISTTAQGSYLKVGIDYNLYRNWLDMDNMIFVGFRAAGSTFSQTLESYGIYDVNNQYWNDNQQRVIANQEVQGLSATWVEILLGIKAELLTNFYAGLNVQLKARITEDEPSDFENLWIPGFNRTFDSGFLGWGIGYTLSYRIPVYKKEKVVYEK